MSFEELEAFVQEEETNLSTHEDQPIPIDRAAKSNKSAAAEKQKGKADRAEKENSAKKADKGENISLGSTSEVTIYKRAVQQLAPELEEQIDQYITNV